MTHKWKLIALYYVQDTISDLFLILMKMGLFFSEDICRDNVKEKNVAAYLS